VCASYLVGYAFADSRAWRWMLGLAAVPGLVMLVGLIGLSAKAEVVDLFQQSVGVRGPHPQQGGVADVAGDTWIVGG
jgi:MFS family permease